MQVIRPGFISVAFALSVFFLSFNPAHAQTAVDYRFLEVMDTEGKPVAGATVESIGEPIRPLKSDENGVVKEFPVYYGDYNTRGLKVSTPGYLTYEQTDISYRLHDSGLLEGEVPQYDPKKIKVVLLRTPKTPAEQRIVEAEQRRRELILAVKGNNAGVVQKLLGAGVSANAADVYGIPVILWAAAKGNSGIIRALLAAGADVRNKHGSGRKALLYYLDIQEDKPAIDGEVVQSLIKAGADLSAVNKRGDTILVLARQWRNEQVIKLLEDAKGR